MDFSLTDDQQLLRDTARKLLDTRVPARAGRARTSTIPPRTLPLWAHLREYTALGLGPATDLCLFLEETGYVAAPGPFLATTALLRVRSTGDEATGTVAIAGTVGDWRRSTTR